MPPGTSIRFHLIRSGREVVTVAPGFRDVMASILEELGRAPGETVTGRAPHPLVTLPSGERVVARHLLHGGVLGRLLGDLYWGGRIALRGLLSAVNAVDGKHDSAMAMSLRPLPRPLQEFVVTIKAVDKGIPVAVPVGARIRWLAAGFYRGDMLTLEIPESRDLGLLLRQEWQGWDRRARTEALAAAARALRRMHDAGLFHADLNLRNLLLRRRERAGEVLFIDLDGAAFYRELTLRQRRANLWRLARSAEKLAPPGVEVSRSERLFFLREYCGQDPALWGCLRESFRRIPAVSALRRIWWSITGGM